MEANEAIQFYIGVVDRRRVALLLPSIASFFLFLAVILKIPFVYSSSAAFVINNQFVPSNYSQVRNRTALATLPTEERLQALKKIVLSRENLLELIHKHALYEGLRNKLSPAALAGRMQARISMNMVRTDIAVGQRNISAGGAYAFALSFEGDSPEQVYAVANSLAELFNRENYRFQKKRIEDAMAVMERQRNDLLENVVSQGLKISEFKRKNQDALPDLFSTYISLLAELESEIERKEQRIDNLRNDERYWSGRLAITPMTLEVVDRAGTKIVSAEEEVRRLRQEYAMERATLSDEHPDVIALQNRLTAVETDAEIREVVSGLADEINKRNLELGLLRKTHSSDHPDVIRLNKEISGMKEELKRFQEEKGAAAVEEEEKSEVNPQYLHIQNELITTRNELARQAADLVILNQTYADYKNRLERIPQVELEYRSLENDYKTVKDQYNEAVDRLTLTREALKGIEGDWAENQFLLIDPPVVPETPDRPNRKMLLIFAFAGSLAIGLTCMIFREYTDRTYYSTEQLASLTGVPVLGGIPRLMTRKRQKIRRILRLATVSLAGFVILAISVIHFWFFPLNELIKKH